VVILPPTRGEILYFKLVILRFFYYRDYVVSIIGNIIEFVAVGGTKIGTGNRSTRGNGSTLKNPAAMVLSPLQI
jgi:hypothetical protein